MSAAYASSKSPFGSGSVLAYELDTKTLDARRAQLRQTARRALRAGVEHRVATTDVDQHGMRKPIVFAQRDRNRFS